MVELGSDEMEEHVFRAGSVFENGMNRSHGASYVLRIQGHCDVDQRRVTGRGRIAGGGGRTFRPVPVLRRLGEAGGDGGRRQFIAESSNSEAEWKEKEKRKGGGE